jgi:hypothetical protein
MDLTFATVLTELAIPFLLWFRAARPYATAMVLGIQLWIVAFFTLPVFPLFTIASTVLFFDEDQLCRRIRAASPLDGSAGERMSAMRLAA